MGEGERPEIWHRLEKAITVPPEFPEVVYVYRNVTNRRPIEYREMLLSDLRERLQDELGFKSRIDHMAIFGYCRGCQEHEKSDQTVANFPAN